MWQGLRADENEKDVRINRLCAFQTFTGYPTDRPTDLQDDLLNQCEDAIKNVQREGKRGLDSRVDNNERALSCLIGAGKETFNVFI